MVTLPPAIPSVTRHENLSQKPLRPAAVRAALHALVSRARTAHPEGAATDEAVVFAASVHPLAVEVASLPESEVAVAPSVSADVVPLSVVVESEAAFSDEELQPTTNEVPTTAKSTKLEMVRMRKPISQLVAELYSFS